MKDSLKIPGIVVVNMVQMLLYYRSGCMLHKERLPFWLLLLPAILPVMWIRLASLTAFPSWDTSHPSIAGIDWLNAFYIQGHPGTVSHSKAPKNLPSLLYRIAVHNHMSSVYTAHSYVLIAKGRLDIGPYDVGLCIQQLHLCMACNVVRHWACFPRECEQCALASLP